MSRNQEPSPPRLNSNKLYKQSTAPGGASLTNLNPKSFNSPSKPALGLHKTSTNVADSDVNTIQLAESIERRQDDHVTSMNLNKSEYNSPPAMNENTLGINPWTTGGGSGSRAGGGILIVQNKENSRRQKPTIKFNEATDRLRIKSDHRSSLETVPSKGSYNTIKMQKRLPADDDGS